MMKEALYYFQESNFDRLFTLFKKKYESLGRIGGTVKIDTFNDMELSAIARFFGLASDELRETGRISLSEFDRQLQRTKFSGVTLKDLLEAYFAEPLISKKEKEQLQKEQQDSFFEKLLTDFPRLEFWLDYIRKRTPDTFWIYRLMDDSPSDFREKIQHLERAFTNLPDELERLPVFSQRITRDPHAFDVNTNLGRLFLHLLAVDHCQEDTVAIPLDTESMNELLLHYHLLRDDITNYVTCANLLAEKDDRVHPLWYAAAETQSVLNIPLRELIGLSRVFPSDGKNNVWIVENSGVYSSILDKVSDVPIICTHGQFKLAALILMDRLVEAGCTIYYSGDFDPEGLGMAEKLLRRYPDHVRLWKMDVEAYKQSLAEVILSKERLNKLNSLVAPELMPVAEKMRQIHRAGYQEALVDQMIEDFKNLGYRSIIFAPTNHQF